MPEAATLSVGIVATAVITFAGTWALVISQRKVRRLSYEVLFGNLIVPFETTAGDDLQVQVRKRLVEEAPGNDLETLVPAGMVYGFSVRLANTDAETIPETEVGLQLDEAAKIVSVNIPLAPLGYPHVRIAPQHQGQRSQARLWLPYLKQGEEIIVSLQSVGNETPCCDVFIPQADVVARDLGARRAKLALLALSPGLLGLLAFVAGIALGIPRYGVGASASDFTNDVPMGPLVLSLQVGGLALMLLGQLSGVWFTLANRRRRRRAVPWLLSVFRRDVGSVE